jgi:hypothetical protein
VRWADSDLWVNSVALLGTLFAADHLRVAPLALALGRSRAGTPSAAKAVRVWNVGGQPLGPVQAALDGAGFQIAEDRCTDRTLPPGASCEVSVILTGPTGGAFRGTLDIRTPMAGPMTVDLSGDVEP